MFWERCLVIIPGRATVCGIWWGGCNKVMWDRLQSMLHHCVGLGGLLLPEVIFLPARMCIMSICQTPHGSSWPGFTDNQEAVRNKDAAHSLQCFQVSDASKSFFLYPCSNMSSSRFQVGSQFLHLSFVSSFFPPPVLTASQMQAPDCSGHS